MPMRPGAYEAQYRHRPRLVEQTAFFPPGYLARPWQMWQASGFRRIEGAARPVNWDVTTQ